MILLFVPILCYLKIRKIDLLIKYKYFKSYLYFTKMRIKVLVKQLNDIQLQNIVDYYNSKKLDTDEPLERLERCEGGFQIQISYMKNQQCDPNNKIKQLRWSKGYLTPMKYINFTYKEQKLLYYALVDTIGEKNVKMECT